MNDTHVVDVWGCTDGAAIQIKEDVYPEARWKRFIELLVGHVELGSNCSFQNFAEKRDISLQPDCTEPAIYRRI